MYVWNLYFRFCLCSCWHAWLHRMLTQMLEMRQLTGEWVLTENFLMCQDTGTSYFLRFYPKLYVFSFRSFCFSTKCFCIKNIFHHKSLNLITKYIFYSLSSNTLLHYVISYYRYKIRPYIAEKRMDDQERTWRKIV